MRNKFRISYPEIFLGMNNLAEVRFFCSKFHFIFCSSFDARLNVYQLTDQLAEFLVEIG